MPYSITRQDAAKDALAVRLILGALPAMVNTGAIERLTELADSIEEQVKPPEPYDFASVVRVKTGTSFVRVGAVSNRPWVSGEERRNWDELDVAEVLRIGVGEVPPTPAEIEQVIQDVTEKERSNHTADVAERVAREVVGRLVQRLPATMFRTRDIDMDEEPSEIEAASAAEWSRLDAANADNDAYQQGIKDERDRLRKRLIQFRSSAITAERKDAFDKAIEAVEATSTEPLVSTLHLRSCEWPECPGGKDCEGLSLLSERTAVL